VLGGVAVAVLVVLVDIPTLLTQEITGSFTAIPIVMRTPLPLPTKIQIPDSCFPSLHMSEVGRCLDEHNV
jgi:hypothetical protein